VAHQRPARPAVVKDTDQHERVHTPEAGDVAGRSLEPPARIRRRTTVKPNGGLSGTLDGSVTVPSDYGTPAGTTGSSEFTAMWSCPST